jgi:hypothetical protein
VGDTRSFLKKEALQHFKFQEVSEEYLNQTGAFSATIRLLLSLQKLHTRKDNKHIECTEGHF